MTSADQNGVALSTSLSVRRICCSNKPDYFQLLSRTFQYGQLQTRQGTNKTTTDHPEFLKSPLILTAAGSCNKTCHNFCITPGQFHHDTKTTAPLPGPYHLDNYRMR